MFDLLLIINYLYYMFSNISDNISLSNLDLLYYEVIEDFILPCDLFEKKSVIRIEEINIKPGDILSIGSIEPIYKYSRRYYGPPSSYRIFFYKPNSQEWQPFVYKMDLDYEFFRRNEYIIWKDITKEMIRDQKLNQIIN